MTRRKLLLSMLGLAAVPVAAGCSGGDAYKSKKEKKAEGKPKDKAK